MRQIWDLDSLENKKNENSVYENIADESRLEGSRYTVKSPIKEDHPVIPEIYWLSAKRLTGLLKDRLDKNKLLLQKYDDAIKEQLGLVLQRKLTNPLLQGKESTYHILRLLEKIMCQQSCAWFLIAVLIVATI